MLYYYLLFPYQKYLNICVIDFVEFNGILYINSYKSYEILYHFNLSSELNQIFKRISHKIILRNKAIHDWYFVVQKSISACLFYELQYRIILIDISYSLENELIQSKRFV